MTFMSKILSTLFASITFSDCFASWSSIFTFGLLLNLERRSAKNVLLISKAKTFYGCLRRISSTAWPFPDPTSTTTSPWFTFSLSTQSGIIARLPKRINLLVILPIRKCFGWRIFAAINFVYCSFLNMNIAIWSIIDFSTNLVP